jgi:uncharacterized beta-barrel protein YwiB (DUF1934 family)
MRKPLKSLAVEIDTATTSQTDAQQTTAGKYEGQLYLTGDGSYMLRYVEELEAKAPVQTTLKIEANEVKLIRHGAQRMNHRFVSGKRTQSVYRTPYGALTMETETLELVWAWYEDAGSLKLVYRLALGGQDVDQLTLHVKIRTVRSKAR